MQIRPSASTAISCRSVSKYRSTALAVTAFTVSSCLKACSRRVADELRKLVNPMNAMGISDTPSRARSSGLVRNERQPPTAA